MQPPCNKTRRYAGEGSLYVDSLGKFGNTALDVSHAGKPAIMHGIVNPALSVGKVVVTIRQDAGKETS